MVAIESGGAFLLRVVAGKEQATDFQKSFYRAGHAHAGVLVTLGLVCLLLAEATTLTGSRAGSPQTGGAGRGDPDVRRVLLLRHGTRAARRRTGPWCCSPVGGGPAAAGVVTLGVGLLLG